jgi:hypothetical protein
MDMGGILVFNEVIHELQPLLPPGLKDRIPDLERTGMFG